MTTVTLFTKPGCHLCEAVEQVIHDAKRTHDFTFEIRNIIDDPQDEARYHDAIPVVFVDGTEIARYRLTEAELVGALVRSRG